MSCSTFGLCTFLKAETKDLFPFDVILNKAHAFTAFGFLGFGILLQNLKNKVPYLRFLQPDVVVGEKNKH